MDPNKFMSFLDGNEYKDKSLEYRDIMEADAEIFDFVKETGDNPIPLLGMKPHERLICEEILLRKYEDEGNPKPSVYDDEEWKKIINVLQENGQLW